MNTKRFPLSSPQKSLWYDAAQRQEPLLYQLSGRIRVTPPFDQDRYDQATAALARRHPMLAARLEEHDGIPVWSLEDRSLPPPMRYQTEGWTEEEREQSIRAFITTPLDLKGPLFTVGIWHQAGFETMVLVWHHLVMDGWSSGLVVRHFLSFYQPDRAKPADRHPPEPYAEFSSWTASYPSTPEGQADAAFWKQKLETRPPFYQLPARQPPSVGTGPGEATVTIETAPGSADRSGLFVRGLAAFLVVLALYSGRKDPHLLVPFLGRPGRRFRNTVGHFVNMVSLGADLEAHETFEALESHLNAEVRAAKRHEAYPFEFLAAGLGQPPSGHSLLSDAYYGIVPVPELEAGGMEFLGFRQGGSPWNLGFEVHLTEKGAFGLLRYPEGTWTDAEIEGLAGRLSALLRRAEADPGFRLTDVPGLTPEEEAALAPRRTEAAAPGSREPSRPMTETEARLARLWEEVLDRPAPGLGADFFAVGGHSLAAARVLARIRQDLGKDVPLSALFLHRTLETLARHLDTLGNAGPITDLVPLRRVGTDQNAGRRLSFSQLRMWYLNLLDPEDPAYNMNAAILVRGSLDLDGLGAAFADLQRRHEALRTTFGSREGEPVQTVGTEAVLSLEVVEADGPDPLARAAERVRASASAAYDLAAGPAVRFLVIRLPDGNQVLSLGMHHILSDQWSIGILSRDLLELYRARRTGGTPVLPELPVTYTDYADHDRQVLETGLRSADAEYWKLKLNGLGPLEWPSDFPRGQGTAPRAGLVRIPLNQDLREAVETLAVRSGRTPFTVYLTAFLLLLHRYSGQQDFAVGVPSANRDDPRLENVVGTFVNTLVLRVRIGDDDRFDTLLDQVGVGFLEAFEHRRYPFEKLVEDLGPARRTGAPPLVQVLFNMANAPGEMPSEPGFEAEPFIVEPTGAQFELSLNIDDQISFSADFSFDGRVFRTATVTTLAQAWVELLGRALEDPRRPWQAVEAVSAAERSLVVEGWNRTDAEYPREGLAELLWKSAARAPQKPAFVFDGRVYSYGEFFALASGWAEALAEKGVGPGDIVALHLDRGPALVLSMLAVLARGATYLPLDPVYPEVRKTYMLAHSGARLLIGTGASDPNEPTAEGVTRIDWRTLEHRTGSAVPVPVGHRTAAYILYTSGSTGTPKGVVVPQGALVNFLTSMRTTPGLGVDDVLLSVTSPSFDISGLEIHLPLLTGATLVMASRQDVTDPAALRTLIRNRGVTFLQATPATWRMLLESGWNERLKTILCGGEAFPADLVPPLLDRADAVWNMYGPTETTIWSTLHRVTAGELSVPVGRPIANTQIYVLDTGRNPVPPLVTADLYIAGDGLALGYHKSPDLTAAAFVPVPWAPDRLMYRTGDRARFLADGEVEFLGRADAQVKVHGHRIELGEIETVLAAYPGVRRAVCAVKEPSPGNKILAGYLVLDEGVSVPGDDDLDAHLLARLPAYMVPASYRIIDAVPLGPSGKVDRRALPEVSPRKAGSAVPPADDFEAQVLEVWKTVLGRQDIGMEDDFFSLGGHSLLAVRLVAALWRVTAIELPLRLFFTQPTARGTARTLKRYLETPGTEHPVAPGETEILYPFQVAGSRPGFFLFAGVFSDEDGAYRYLSTLVHHVGQDRPLYLLRPKGLVRDAAPFQTVAEMAGLYIQEMKAVQPRGPYRLVGECVGGIYAFEAARQLQEAGETVESLILLDTEFPGRHELRQKNSWRVLRTKVRRMIGSLVYLLRPDRQILRRFSESVQRSAARKHQAEALDAATRIIQVEERYSRLAAEYRVPTYPGVVHLLINQADHGEAPGLGWIDSDGSPRRAAEVRVVPVSGNHVTRLTEHGAETGRKLIDILDGGQ